MPKTFLILLSLLCSVLFFKLYCHDSISLQEPHNTINSPEKAQEILDIIPYMEQATEAFQPGNMARLTTEQKYNLFELFIEYIGTFPQAFTLVGEDPSAYINSIFCPYLNLFIAASTTMSPEFLSEITPQIQTHRPTTLALTAPGKPLDPTYLFCAALNDFYKCSIESKKFAAPDFDIYMSEGIKMMDAKGKDHYTDDDLYQNLLNFRFKLQIQKIIEQCQPEGDIAAYMTDLRSYSLEFTRASTAPTPCNIPLFILAYMFDEGKSEKKEFSPKILAIINKMDETTKLTLLESFAQFLLMKKKYHLVEGLLGCEALSSFTAQHDALLIPRLLAKIYLGQDITEYDEKLKTLKPHYLPQQANLFTIFCRVGNAEKARSLLQKLFVLAAPQPDIVLQLLAQYRNAFIYNVVAENGNYDAVHPEHFRTITDFYERLADLSEANPDPSIHTIALRNAFKLYRFQGDEAKATKCVDKLARVDSNFLSYQTFMATVSENENPIQKLKDLTTIIDEEEVALLHFFDNQRLSIMLASLGMQQQQVVAQNKMDEKNRLTALEQAKRLAQTTRRTVRLNAITIPNSSAIAAVSPLDLTTFFTIISNGRIFYIYCDEATLNAATSEEVIQFKEALAQSEFAEKFGSIGVKYLSPTAYELKIKGGARIFGFMRESTVIKNGQSDGKVKIIHFCKYHTDPHANYYTDLIKIMERLNKSSEEK
jgi:tetratricopeptide (TPR) repeat protein